MDADTEPLIPNPPSPIPTFLGIPSPGPERADVLLLPLPVEETVSYGRGTAGGPAAILAASLQIETFDEETLVDFTESPRVHVLPPAGGQGGIEERLAAIEREARRRANRFLLALGGEHTITYGMVTGLAPDPAEVTVVQIDAHADLADTLGGRHWSHGTVMRRLWERGCRLIQIGIRSLSRKEHEFATTSPRVTTYYAHQLGQRWAEVLQCLRALEGKVYLTIDVDGLDPAVIASTGTPQPGGLSWAQTMELLRALAVESRAQLLAADIVEFVPSSVAPGCDPAAARLAAKVLAWWWRGRKEGSRD